MPVKHFILTNNFIVTCKIISYKNTHDFLSLHGLPRPCTLVSHRWFGGWFTQSSLYSFTIGFGRRFFTQNWSWSTQGLYCRQFDGSDYIGFLALFRQKWHVYARGVEIQVVNHHEKKAGKKCQVVSDDSGVVIPNGWVGVKEPNEDHGGVFTEAKSVENQVFVASTFFFGIKEWENVDGTEDEAKQNFFTLKKRKKMVALIWREKNSQKTFESELGGKIRQIILACFEKFDPSFSRIFFKTFLKPLEQKFGKK